MLAAEGGSAASVAALMAAGADIERKDAAGFSPAALACASGQTGSLSEILSGGASANEVVSGIPNRWSTAPRAYLVGLPLLHVAVREGHPQAADALLTAGASAAALCPDGRTVFHQAAEAGNGGTSAKLFARLVDGGAAVDGRDEHGTTALMAALGRGNECAAKGLVAIGADINAVQAKDGAVECACRPPPFRRALAFEAGAGREADCSGGWTPLFHLVNGHHNLHFGFLSVGLTRVQGALSLGADPTRTDVHDRTPLDIALRSMNAQAAAAVSTGRRWDDQRESDKALRVSIEIARTVRAGAAWWRRRHAIAAWSAANPWYGKPGTGSDEDDAVALAADTDTETEMAGASASTNADASAASGAASAAPAVPRNDAAPTTASGGFVATAASASAST